jgi:hypothetical protein
LKAMHTPILSVLVHLYCDIHIRCWVTTVKQAITQQPLLGNGSANTKFLGSRLTQQLHIAAEVMFNIEFDLRPYHEGRDSKIWS